MKTASGLAMAVVVVALLVAGGTALKLYMDQQSMLVMIDGYGRAVSGLSTTTPGTASAVATANQHAGVGDYEAAGQALDQVLTLVNQTPATPQGPAGPGGPGPGGMMPNYGFGNNPGAPPAPTDEQIDDALNEVPEETRAFFAEHRKLLGRLMVQNQTTMGAIDPDEWNQYTAVVLGAAADGDADTVKGAMDRFDQAL
ncbi:MAG TPA: hypothetical protein QGH10_09970, partial [Armatimonadota bacterium]|nr:hypothetical protein [Armatimonadota bacterium]